MDQEKQHTPGPWAWHINRKNCFEVVATDRPLIIAKLSGMIEDAWNAHLIASAPELLEALEAFLPENTQYIWKAYDNAVDKARAVIARARGQQ